MLALTAERALFKFSANTPDSPEALQLPPRNGSCSSVSVCQMPSLPRVPAPDTGNTPNALSS